MVRDQTLLPQSRPRDLTGSLYDACRFLTSLLMVLVCPRHNEHLNAAGNRASGVYTASLKGLTVTIISPLGRVQASIGSNSPSPVRTCLRVPPLPPFAAAASSRLAVTSCQRPFMPQTSSPISMCLLCILVLAIYSRSLVPAGRITKLTAKLYKHALCMLAYCKMVVCYMHTSFACCYSRAESQKMLYFHICSPAFPPAPWPTLTLKTVTGNMQS